MSDQSPGAEGGSGLSDGQVVIRIVAVMILLAVLAVSHLYYKSEVGIPRRLGAMMSGVKVCVYPMAHGEEPDELLLRLTGDPVAYYNAFLATNAKPAFLDLLQSDLELFGYELVSRREDAELLIGYSTTNRIMVLEGKSREETGLGCLLVTDAKQGVVLGEFVYNMPYSDTDWSLWRDSLLFCGDWESGPYPLVFQRGKDGCFYSPEVTNKTRAKASSEWFLPGGDAVLRPDFGRPAKKVYVKRICEDDRRMRILQAVLDAGFDLASEQATADFCITATETYDTYGYWEITRSPARTLAVRLNLINLRSEQGSSGELLVGSLLIVGKDWIDPDAPSHAREHHVDSDWMERYQASRGELITLLRSAR